MNFYDQTEDRPLGLATAIREAGNGKFKGRNLQSLGFGTKIELTPLPPEHLPPTKQHLSRFHFTNGNGKWEAHTFFQSDFMKSGPV